MQTTAISVLVYSRRLKSYTGPFNRSVISYTPIQCCQKCSFRLILAEKSSQVHDILWIYVPFNVVGLWKKSVDILKFLHFNKYCKDTLKIDDYRKSVLFCQYLFNESSDLHKILNLSSYDNNWTPEFREDLCTLGDISR